MMGIYLVLFKCLHENRSEDNCLRPSLTSGAVAPSAANISSNCRRAASSFQFLLFLIMSSNVDIASALPAGTNAIGKLSANSGVDIGDVDVTSIAAGTNRIGHVVARANEAADGSGTERHLLCDSAGHLQFGDRRSSFAHGY